MEKWKEEKVDEEERERNTERFEREKGKENKEMVNEEGE